MLVCTSWSMPFELNQRLWKQNYARNYELKTADSSEIAINGNETAWKLRFSRMHQTETILLVLEISYILACREAKAGQFLI